MTNASRPRQAVKRKFGPPTKMMRRLSQQWRDAQPGHPRRSNPKCDAALALLAEWSKAAKTWHEERLTQGLRVQIETMVAIARGREGNLKRACEERDLLRLTVNALDVDDRNRVLKLAAALMKHAVQEVCRSGNPDGSPKVTGLRCKECDAEIDYEKAALLEHKPGCIVAGFFDA